jgi:putative phage-type endonuclease
MEQRLTEWLLDNRPFTHLHTRIKQFCLFCKSLQPELSYSAIKREVIACVDTLFRGDLGRLWMRDRCYERVLRLYGANDQRTDGWHAKRGEMITASEVYNIFGSEAARKEVMMRKLEPRKEGDGPPIAALAWGTRFEPVAKRLYEERTKCKITDVSCVQHPIHKFLGASPDGLIVPDDGDDLRRYGRLVEFKCPMSRVEKPEIPMGYIHQMQMQMECTGIDECEYVEFRFKQVQYTEWLRSTSSKGSFAVYETGKVEYDVTEVPEDAQMIYWVLGSIKEDFVPKDPNWLPNHLEGLTKFWEEVLEHRKNDTRPDEKKLPSLEL